MVFHMRAAEMGWLKSILYDLGKIANDTKAVQKNTKTKRIVRRGIGKNVFKGVNKLLK